MARAWMPSPEVQAWLREVYSYDPETGVVSRRGKPVETFDPSTGYKRFRVSCSRLGLYRMVRAHQMAWFLMTGEFVAGLDHINRDRADNRACNLRVASHAENSRNRTKMRGETSSRFKGVCWSEGRWRAQIKVLGPDGTTRLIRMGRHESEEAAARAYDEAALRYHGEFASLNFPQQRAA